ncbi:Interferon omega [Salix suchowensis]|nr:Interferon omega [Salix suchowensis]
MEHFRSRSCRDGRIQMEGYHGDRAAPPNMQNLRSYSVSNAVSIHPNHQLGNKVKIKKGKINLGSISKRWSFNDPELQRKRRVANYKVYAMEGKVKGTLRKSFRWVKNTCTQVVHGWR